MGLLVPLEGRVKANQYKVLVSFINLMGAISCWITMAQSIRVIKCDYDVNCILNASQSPDAITIWTSMGDLFGFLIFYFLPLNACCILLQAFLTIRFIIVNSSIFTYSQPLSMCVLLSTSREHPLVPQQSWPTNFGLEAFQLLLLWESNHSNRKLTRRGLRLLWTVWRVQTV